MDPVEVKGMWARFAAAGFPTPAEFVDPDAADPSPSPFAPGLEVSADRIAAGSPTEAAWLAARAADPEVVFAAARDRRHVVQAAAVSNPRCPVEAIRDVALGSSPVVELPVGAAVRLPAEVLCSLVCARGPRLAPLRGWPVPFTSAQLAVMFSAADPAERSDLLERIVFPTLARWVRTGDPDGFEVGRVADLVAGSEFDSRWLGRAWCTAVARELDDFTSLPGSVAARLAALDVVRVDSTAPQLGHLLSEATVLDPDAVVCFARSTNVSLFHRALSEDVRLGPDELEVLVAAAVDEERFALVAHTLDGSPRLYHRLSPRSRSAVAARLSNPRKFGVLASVALVDPDVDLDVRVQLFSRAEVEPSLESVSPVFVETWAEFTRRAIERRPRRADELQRAVRSAGFAPVLATRHRELVWELLDVLAERPPAWTAAYSFDRVLGATAPVPAGRLARWLVRFPQLAEKAARGWFLVSLDPTAAAGVLAERLAADGAVPSPETVRLAAEFADVLDADPAGAELLGSVPGVVAALAELAELFPSAIAPLARRLTDAGVDVDGWRLAEPLAAGWPGSLDELVATAAAALTVPR